MQAPSRLRRFALAATAALPLALAAVPAHASTTEEVFFHDIEVDYAAGIAELVAKGFDPNTHDAKGQPALAIALQGESLKAARALWESPGIQIDARNQAGETPLMLAALKGEADAAAALVAHGASVQKDGWSPLHYAATGGNAAIVKMLLAHGATLEARSPNATTPLMMAARYGSEDAVDALLAAGADRSLKNDQGMDAAAFATSVGRDKLAARLKVPAH
jgi:ankyrin repeat protein